MRRQHFPAIFFVLALAAHAGDADADWQGVLALDAGPQATAKSPADAQTVVVEHLAKQERALRGFLAGHAGDARAFEAKLRILELTREQIAQ